MSTVSSAPAGATAAGTAGDEAVLSVRDLSVSFRTETGTVCAVDGVSFDLHRGEVVALVGESGCGKSVTAMTLGGLSPSSARVTGSIRLQGRELVGAPERELRAVRGARLAYVFQEPTTSLNPVLTVGRQVTEVVRRHEQVSRSAARDRAVELFTTVGIPAPERRVGEYPHQLSGGMRQRVMIAMALACNPDVLVADEPTTALDVTVQAGILDTLRELGERLGTAILLITHDLGVVADVADRVVVMYAGRAVERADVADLFTRPSHPYTTGLLGAVPTGRGRLQEIPGLVPVLDDTPDACTFAPRCDRATEQCSAHSPGPDPVAGSGPGHRVRCFHPVDHAVDHPVDRSGANA